MRHHIQIVRDENLGHPERPLQIHQEGQDIRLD
jgi:hypothetical protein